jgi:hypothetical protein
MILECVQEDQSGAKVATNKIKNRVQATRIGSDLHPLGSDLFFDGQRRSHRLVLDTALRRRDPIGPNIFKWDHNGVQ